MAPVPVRGVQDVAVVGALVLQLHVFEGEGHVVLGRVPRELHAVPKAVQLLVHDLRPELQELGGRRRYDAVWYRLCMCARHPPALHVLLMLPPQQPLLMAPLLLLFLHHQLLFLPVAKGWVAGAHVRTPKDAHDCFKLIPGPLSQHIPSPSRTHQLLRAVPALLVRPVEGELLVLHLVAGVEGAGELHGGAIQGIDGGGSHDLHPQSCGCCSEQSKGRNVELEKGHKHPSCWQSSPWGLGLPSRHIQPGPGLPCTAVTEDKEGASPALAPSLG